MAMTMNYCFRESIIYASLEALVPETHFVRKLDRCIDWRFIYSRVAHLYSPAGRPSIDPVILFKMLCINIVFGFNSMRRTCRECDMNVAYRWFLGTPSRKRYRIIRHSRKTISVAMETAISFPRSLNISCAGFRNRDCWI